MRKRPMIARILCFCLGLFLLLGGTAYAEAPSDAPQKGIAAVSTEKVSSADASACENEELEMLPVKVGLNYGETALYEVTFTNISGQGFQIGSYDEDRVFHVAFELDSSVLIIRPERRWHLLFHQIFDSMEEAQSFAAANKSTALELNGEYRAYYGSFDTLAEIEYLIRRWGYDGDPWQDENTGIYNSWGQALTLVDGNDDLAVQAIADGKAKTAFREHVYYGGFLLHPESAYRYSVINVVGLEDYVKGVIPYEMSPSWPYEALRAQAVCARTYAVYNRDGYAEFGFDLRDDTESQVYSGTDWADAVTDAAVDSTAGLFVRYEGKLCEIYYFASDGGATEDGRHVFDADRPYLAGKLDPYEQAVDAAVIRWDRWRSGDSIAWRLAEEGWTIGTVVRVEPEYSELGNVIAVSYYDQGGQCVRLEGRESYAVLGLSNCRFTVEKTDEGFSFVGKGWGHNCGMSQWGANAMASVYGFSCEDIIEFYFTGAYVG